MQQARQGLIRHRAMCSQAARQRGSIRTTIGQIRCERVWILHQGVTLPLRPWWLTCNVYSNPVRLGAVDGIRVHNDSDGIRVGNDSNFLLARRAQQAHHSASRQRADDGEHGRERQTTGAGECGASKAWSHCKPSSSQESPEAGADGVDQVR